MLIVTTERVPGHEVTQTLGACFGLVVRSRGALPNFVAGLRSFVGGEIPEYTAMLEQARTQAMERLAEHARQLGGNAVVMMRFDSSEMAETMSEIVAYGTAVVVQPAPAASPWSQAR